MGTDQLADRLETAVRTGSAIRPLTEETPLSLEEAYMVQEAVLARLDPEGRSGRRAAKLGLTSRAKQQQMGVKEALYGWFPSGSGLDIGEPLTVSELIQPRIEPEVAFLTGHRLAGADVTAADVLAATTAVAPAFDVLDSRFAGYEFTLPDVIADNASAARYVVGNPVPPADIALDMVGCVFERNCELMGTAAGAAVLGHPAAAVAWFVRRLADRGQDLAANSLVLAGALTAAVPVGPGDELRLTIDRVGSVDLVCASD